MDILSYFSNTEIAQDDVIPNKYIKRRTIYVSLIVSCLTCIVIMRTGHTTFLYKASVFYSFMEQTLYII